MALYGTACIHIIAHLGVLRGHVGVGAVVGRVAVPLERDGPLPGLGAALDLLYLGSEVDVLPEVELFREPVSRQLKEKNGGTR